MVELVKLEKEDLNELTDIAINSFREDKNIYGNFPPLIDIEHNRLHYIDDGLTFKILSDGKMVGGTFIFNNGNNRYTLGSIFY